jgi:dolichyl-phosphate beta-glucosyltransferase
MTNETPPLLSLILPAHNEERRLGDSLAKIDAFLRTQPYSAEVLVVENGSRDRTSEIGHAFAQTHPYVRVLNVTTRGKGLAIKAGMLVARGEYRFFADVDFSMPIEDIVRFLPPHSDGYDIVISTREGAGAQRVGEPEHRHLMGRVNNWIIKLFTHLPFEDTQCGFKLFTRAVAEDLFAVQRMNGIGFDVELLYIAAKRGYKVREVPITWYYDGDSKMKLIDDSLNMIREVWQVRQNWGQGLYAKKSR